MRKNFLLNLCEHDFNDLLITPDWLRSNNTLYNKCKQTFTPSLKQTNSITITIFF